MITLHDKHYKSEWELLRERPVLTEFIHKASCIQDAFLLYTASERDKVSAKKTKIELMLCAEQYNISPVLQQMPLMSDMSHNRIDNVNDLDEVLLTSSSILGDCETDCSIKLYYVNIDRNVKCKHGTYRHDKCLYVVRHEYRHAQQLSRAREIGGDEAAKKLHELYYAMPYFNNPLENDAQMFAEGTELDLDIVLKLIIPGYYGR